MFNEQRFEEIKAMVQQWIDSEIEVDVSELPSYTYSPARTWDYKFNPEPEESDWDEDEEIEAKTIEAIKYIEADGLYQYIDISEDEEAVYQPKILEWLNSKI